MQFIVIFLLSFAPNFTNSADVETSSSTLEPNALCIAPLVFNNCSNNTFNISMDLAGTSALNIEWWVEVNGVEVYNQSFTGYQDLNFSYQISQGTTVQVYGRAQTTGSICSGGLFYFGDDLLNLGCNPNIPSDLGNVYLGTFFFNSNSCAYYLTVDSPPSGYSWHNRFSWAVTFTGTNSSSFSQDNPNATFRYNYPVNNQTTMILHATSIFMTPIIPNDWPVSNIELIRFSGVAKDGLGNFLVITGETNSISPSHAFCT